MNVFKKCLMRQIGNRKYCSYIKSCKEKFNEGYDNRFEAARERIFNDMYTFLKSEEKGNTAERMGDILTTVKEAFRITKYFSFVVLTYIVGNIVLIALKLDYSITCLSMGLMGICFLYKVIEFVSNKFCVFDAYIFMIYKSVVEKIEKEEK